MPRRLLLPLALACLASSSTFSQSPEPTHNAYLESVRIHMNRNLLRQPNYTCLQTIARSRRTSPGQPYRFIDRVRLEVGFIAGKEMFAWPGERTFDDRDLGDMVLGGAIGNGNFALHEKALFSTSSPVFRFMGESIVNRKAAWRWDFNVTRERSGYTLRNGEKEAVVAFHGSFWAEQDTNDVLRLEVIADDIPASLGITLAADAVEYERLPIGGEQFLLPVRSELRLGDYGGESRNTTEFTGCHQYLGESKIIFEDAGDAKAEEKLSSIPVDVPPNLDFVTEISKTIDLRTAAVGDAVEGVVTGNVKWNHDIVIPKGTHVEGRLLWVRQEVRQSSYYVAGLRLTHLTARGVELNFRARLMEVQNFKPQIDTVPPGQVARGFGNSIVMSGEFSSFDGLLFVKNSTPLLPKGLRLWWHTQNRKEDK